MVGHCNMPEPLMKTACATNTAIRAQGERPVLRPLPEAMHDASRQPYHGWKLGLLTPLIRLLEHTTNPTDDEIAAVIASIDDCDRASPALTVIQGRSPARVRG